MKTKCENGVYFVEPETSDEEKELLSLIARLSRRGLTAAGAFPANHSRLSSPAHSMAGAG